MYFVLPGRPFFSFLLLPLLLESETFLGFLPGQALPGPAFPEARWTLDESSCPVSLSTTS